MTIKELKLNYQSIVNDCRKAEKTGDAFLARVAAMNALELAQNTFMGVVADIAPETKRGGYIMGPGMQSLTRLAKRARNSWRVIAMNERGIKADMRLESPCRYETSTRG